MSTNVSLLVCFVNLVESVLILYEKYYTVTLCNLTVTLYLHKVTVRFHKVIVRFHKVTVSTNYEIELKNQYLMLDNFIICYSIKIFITLQYYIKYFIGYLLQLFFLNLKAYLLCRGYMNKRVDSIQ